MAKLFIVESPGKLKTLRKILGPDFILEASVGHTTELGHDGPKRLGFELKNGKVLTHYVARGDRGKQVLKKLKEAAARADMVYLATDPDREGEAIAWHLVDQLKIKKFCRIAYTQITEVAVKKALANPLELDRGLIESQRARQCLDKLVGYEVSPLLWNSTGGKSAGRVQSATLHLVCERERERMNFKPEKYWVLKSEYREGLTATYEPEAQVEKPAPAQGETADFDVSVRVKTEAEAKRIEEIARTNPHIVDSCELKVEPRNPPPPLITSSLQQVAGVKFKFSPKHTMKVAQELYEGINGKGLITYMRTDAVTLSPEFIDETRQWLGENAPEVLPDKAPTYRAKADSQAAHEAIRPTTVVMTPEKARSMLSPDQLKLYSLIWERAVASQCKPARLSKTKITILAEKTRWVARGTMVVEPGYLRFWKNLEEDKELPKVVAQQKLDLNDVKVSLQETKPPPRYSEPRLVQVMERKGIGRPSTYASTIATLKDREYVRLEQAVLVPTPLGMATDDALSRALPDLIDTNFTATMEDALDQIAEGKLPWEKYLCDWNEKYLQPALITARQALVGVQRVAQANGPSRSAGGASGSGFTESPDRAEKIAKAFAAAKKNEVVPQCPKSHGELVLRLSKKEVFFWKCVFPECDAMAWYQNFSTQKCPVCSARMEKIPSRKVAGGYFLKCVKRAAHPNEVVMFKNKRTKEWELARTQSQGRGLPPV